MEGGYEWILRSFNKIGKNSKLEFLEDSIKSTLKNKYL